MENNKNTLVLTTISCTILGVLVPLLVWFANKDTMEEETKKYLVHLLNFQLTLLIAFVILFAVNIIPLLGQLICFIGSPILIIANIILMIVAAIKLSNNQVVKFPFVIELIK